MSCFHCGEAIPNGLTLEVEIQGQSRAMCCVGCQAVAQAIMDNGLDDYYTYRTQNAEKAVELLPEGLKRLSVLDEQSLQEEFVTFDGESKETILSISGISCAACAWLIEKHLQPLPGVLAVNVNASNYRATISWDEKTTRLSDIIKAIAKIGYQANPFKPNELEAEHQAIQQSFMRRLGVAGLFTMQVMMLAVGLYFGVFEGIDEQTEEYFRWISLFLTTPVIGYSAQPFLFSAIRSVRALQPNMDVPVSLAIFGAFFASLYATVSGTGEIYFESVSMFTFLLLIGKFLEFRARSKAAEISNNLLKYTPLSSTLISADGDKNIPAKHLNVADRVRILPGEMVPTDCKLVQGSTSVSEAMLTGEQKPVSKTPGDMLLAGTINHDGSVEAEVSARLNDSTLYSIIRMQQTSAMSKPKLALVADKVARFFVVGILFLSACTAAYWWVHAPQDAFWITLSVLVATCPCALSLATPTALTAAAASLNKLGVFITQNSVLENLHKVTRVVFDKTGTLTLGQFSIKRIEMHDDTMTQEQALNLAAALEKHSEHALAYAFKHINPQCELREVKIHPGLGIQAEYQNQQVKIGSASFVAHTDSDAQVHLSMQNTLIASFYLEDGLRPDAGDTIARLHKNKLGTELLTGDASSAVTQTATALGIKDVHAGCLPQDKLARIETLMQQGEKPMVLGDGINDAPVLSRAYISAAMGEGTDIAKASADIILMNNKLSNIGRLFGCARLTRRVVKQNLGWALGYNALILPLAMSGQVTPYIAVIGMSLSSLLVVSNSLRLLRQ